MRKVLFWSAVAGTVAAVGAVVYTAAQVARQEEAGDDLPKNWRAGIDSPTPLDLAKARLADALLNEASGEDDASPVHYGGADQETAAYVDDPSPRLEP